MDVNRDDYFQECFSVHHECCSTETSFCDDHEKLKNNVNSNIAMTRDIHSKHETITRPHDHHEENRVVMTDLDFRSWECKG